jgi:ankyrin repeat protein
MISLILGTNITTTFCSLTPLHVAVREGRADFIFQLMNNTEGKKLNFEKDMFGETPLHKAGRHGRDFISFILLNGNADIEAKNIFQSTPLHLGKLI